MISWQTFTLYSQIFRVMNRFMRKLKRKMSGMADKMKITTITRTKAITILRHRGQVISSLEVAEEITRLGRGHQGNLISNSMDMNQMQIGQLRILRLRKSHPNMKMIQIFTMLSRLL